MRKVVNIFILLLFTAGISFGSKIELPEVLFPIEVVAERQEKKPPVKPPKKINYDVKVKLSDKIINYLKPLPPIDTKLLDTYIEPPSSFLGLPRDNAILSSAIKHYYAGNYLFAKSRIEKLFEAYKKNIGKKDIYGKAYFLLGLIEYKLENRKGAYNYLKKACEYPIHFKEQTSACLSAQIVAYQLNNIKDAEEIEKKLKVNTLDGKFLKAIKYFLRKDFKTAHKILSKINCDALSVNLIDYCRYVKGYVNFANGYYQSAIYTLKKVKSPNYRKQAQIMLGYSYLKIGKNKEAEAVFRSYLERYGSADEYSTLAYYGLGLVNLKKGLLQKALKIAGILESRNRTLAQNLYLKVADFYKRKGNYKKAFVLYQVALKLAPEHKTDIKKKLVITAYNDGNYDYAYKLAKGINDPMFYLIKGYSEYWLKMYREAAKDLEKAVKGYLKKKDKLLALQILADIYYRNDMGKKYLDTLKEIKKYDIKLARDLLGWYFFKKKKYDKAYKAFVDPYMKAVSLFNLNQLDKALNIAKNIPDKRARFLEAYIYLRKGQYQKARDLLKELAKSKDKLGEEAAYLYAFSYFAEGDYSKAIEELRKFLQFAKDEELRKIATLRLADSYYNLGNKELARKIYEDFIRKHADSPEAIDAAYQLTVLEMDKPDTDIEKQIVKFIKKYPSYPMADLLKLQLVDIYIDKKRYADAEKLLKEIADKNKRESEYALYKLGYVKYLQGEIDEAKKVLREYLAKYKKGQYRIAAIELLAKMYEEENDYNGAIIYVSQLPKTSKNMYRLANLYFKVGDYKNAEYFYKELYNQYPEYRSDIAYYLGVIALKKNKLDEAEEYFNEAINGSNYDNVAASYYYLGLIAMKKGKNEEALNHFLNVIYLYSENEKFASKARLRAAEIMKKQNRKREASCMLKRINTRYLDEKELEIYRALKKTLPKCLD